MGFNDNPLKNQEIVYFISKQILLYNKRIKEKPLNFDKESPFLIKISCFNYFSNNQTKSKKNLFQELSSIKIQEDDDNNSDSPQHDFLEDDDSNSDSPQHDFLEDDDSSSDSPQHDFLEDDDSNSDSPQHDFLEDDDSNSASPDDSNSDIPHDEFIIRLPYNEDNENNYEVPFLLEIDIKKEYDQKKEYDVFLIKSDGYSSADFNKDCIKIIRTFKRKNEFIMKYFHVAYLGTLNSKKANKYKIEIPTNSTKIKKGYWRFQLLIISWTDGIEFHKSFPFSTITSKRMFRDTKNSYIIKLIEDLKNKGIDPIKDVKSKEKFKYIRNVIIEQYNMEYLKFYLYFASTTQTKKEINNYLENYQNEVDKRLKKKNFWAAYDENIFYGDIFKESLFNEKKYKEKVNEKYEEIKRKIKERKLKTEQEKQRKNKGKQHQEDEGPVKADENKYLDNTELTLGNRSEQHQEEEDDEGPVKADENKYLDNTESTLENRSEQHQEEDEGPVKADENKYLDNTESTLENRSEQLQETNLGKRKALKDIEHGNNKKKK